MKDIRPRFSVKLLRKPANRFCRGIRQTGRFTMDLNEREVVFLERFIGRTDISLFAEDDFPLAMGLHERLQAAVHILQNGGTIQ